MGIEEFLVNVTLLSYFFGVNAQIMTSEKDPESKKKTTFSLLDSTHDSSKGTQIPKV